MATSLFPHPFEPLNFNNCSVKHSGGKMPLKSSSKLLSSLNVSGPFVVGDTVVVAVACCGGVGCGGSCSVGSEPAFATAVGCGSSALHFSHARCDFAPNVALSLDAVSGLSGVDTDTNKPSLFSIDLSFGPFNAQVIVFLVELFHAFATDL